MRIKVEENIDWFNCTFEEFREMKKAKEESIVFWGDEKCVVILNDKNVKKITKFANE